MKFFLVEFPPHNGTILSDEMRFDRDRMEIVRSMANAYIVSAISAAEAAEFAAREKYSEALATPGKRLTCVVSEIEPRTITRSRQVDFESKVTVNITIW